MIPAAARLLARAFVTSPTHIAAFGMLDLERTEVFFYAQLAALDGPAFVAMQGSRLVGFAHWDVAPHSRFTAEHDALVVEAVTRSADAETAQRLRQWFSAWRRHAPARPHVHLGPLAVDPDLRGTGIGSRLMARFCDGLDRTGLPGYLETDRLFQVTFFRRFEFEVVQEIDVLGRRHWLMMRPGASAVPSWSLS